MAKDGIKDGRWAAQAFSGIRYASYLNWLAALTLVLALSRYIQGDPGGGGAMLISSCLAYGYSKTLRELIELKSAGSERSLDD